MKKGEYDFFLGRRIKNDSNYFHECVIEKFLRIQSLDQQIKIYEYFFIRQ